LLEAIAARAYGEGLPDGIESGLEATEFFRPPALVYPFGAHIAVVEADRETGRVTVRDFISVDDCGVRISPTLVAGQVHGGSRRASRRRSSRSWSMERTASS